MRCRVILKPGLRRPHDAIIPALDPDRATTTDRKDHKRQLPTHSPPVLPHAGRPALAATPQDPRFTPPPTIHGSGQIPYAPDVSATDRARQASKIHLTTTPRE